MRGKKQGILAVLIALAVAAGLAAWGTTSSPGDAGETRETEVVSPQIILESQKPPVYPPAAMAGRFAGSVMLEITVGKDGKVGRAEVLECTRPKVGFEQAAVDAVKKWLFEPGRKGDEPVEFTLKFRMNFRREGPNGGRPHISAGSFTASTGSGSASDSPATSTRNR